jgi:hypothetical protein
MKFLVLVLLLTSLAASAAPIGTITELTGTVVEIKRNKQSIAGKANTGVESMDTVTVGSKTTTGITFADNTKVKITENSKLVIDDFVYDPKNSDAGKLGMKVALGTVRYTSGQIAKNNAQNVNLKTPTATVSVRGTDFAMTVDEVGRSIVVLLPSCKDDRDIGRYEISGNCTVGMIDVATEAGMVTLNQPFTATYVTDSQQPPLPVVKIDPNLMGVNNDQNLKKPEAIARAEKDREERKDSDKDKSRTKEDERKVASDNNEQQRKSKGEETVVMKAASEGDLSHGPENNPCYPFTECGNEKGMNWYHRIDDDRGNTIKISSGERLDNTTYNISINANDIETKVVGTGSNKVTVRIWNR